MTMREIVARSSTNSAPPSQSQPRAPTMERVMNDELTVRELLAFFAYYGSAGAVVYFVTSWLGVDWAALLT